MKIATKPSKPRPWNDAPPSVEVASTQLYAHMRRSGGKVVLTRKGRAAAVALDLRSYREMMAQVERLATIDAIGRGLDAARRGRTRPWEQVEAEMRKELGLPRRRYRAGRG